MGREGERRRGKRGEAGGKNRGDAPGAGPAAAASRALGRLLQRPLRERRVISELGALRCQPGHHLTLGRLALDAASPALAPPTVGGEQRRQGGTGRDGNGRDGAAHDGTCRRRRRPGQRGRKRPLCSPEPGSPVPFRHRCRPHKAGNPNPSSQTGPPHRPAPRFEESPAVIRCNFSHLLLAIKPARV